MPAATSEFLGEVDEPFDLGDEAPVEVLPRDHLLEDGAPDRGDVGLVGVGPAEPRAGSLLPVLALRHVRPCRDAERGGPVSYTHLRAHETDSYLVCRLLLEKKKHQ